MWLSRYLFSGAAPRRTIQLDCQITTCVFITKVIFSLVSYDLISFRTFVIIGVGKSHNDAASVRTTCHIPASCGLYYFEVKIISKGRDGYMGIGLTASSASNFKMNRLPGKFWAHFHTQTLLIIWLLLGWDKQSYGYHGDDGNSFCSSGNGQ